MRCFLFLFLSILIVKTSFSQIISTDSLTSEQFLIDPNNVVDITYIANDGFILSGGGKKVFIDGIFSNGAMWHAPTAQMLSQERAATSPFDNITVLLVSHKHEDHINPTYEAEHMVNDVVTKVICPVQVNTLLQATTNYNTIKSRIVVVEPTGATSVDTTVQGIPFRTVFLPHPGDAALSVENIGYIYTLNGYKIFHPGDGVSNDLTVYQNLNLAAENIDIAFFPRWYFDTEKGDKGTQIMKYINPKVIIATHVTIGKYDYYRTAAKSIQGIAPVYFMETQLSLMELTRQSNVSSGLPLADCAGVIGGTAIFDKCGVCVGGTTGKTACVDQTISLEKGWNLISINVLPLTQDCLAHGEALHCITMVFNGLDVQTIKTMSTFWSKNQPAYLNTLQTITPGEGYLVYMNVAGTLTVTGVPIDIGSATSSRAPNINWNLIGCPYQTATPFATEFNSTNCQIIKNFDGFWIPNGTQNSIQNFEPGKGYFIRKK